MNYTSNKELRLPESSDRFDIDDFNENFEKLDPSILADEDGSIDFAEAILYLKKDIDQEHGYHSYTASLSADDHYNVTIERALGARYDGARYAWLKLYEDLEAEINLRVAAELYADNVVRLQGGTGVLEVTSNGVTFNGKSLGGSGVSIGALTAITSGISNSVIGLFVEEET